MVNNNCFCHKKLTILADIWSEDSYILGLTGLESLKVFLLPGNKVISAYVPGGELRIVKKCVRARKRILS